MGLLLYTKKGKERERVRETCPGEHKRGGRGKEASQRVRGGKESERGAVGEVNGGREGRRVRGREGGMEEYLYSAAIVGGLGWREEGRWGVVRQREGWGEGR